MRRSLLASLLFTVACSAAYADQPAQFSPGAMPSARIALDIANAKIRAPYDVQVMRENGDVLPTFGQRDRYYVEGALGERYVIRVTNPTARRVEAVVSVDGLDVIDGEAGDLRKRGYVIQPYGEVRVEGFRTSAENVATFRFSSVGGSYAGEKGKARNVGVIAVAIFEETAPPPMPVLAAPVDRGYDYRYDLDDEGDAAAAPRRTRGGAPRTASASPPPSAPAGVAQKDDYRPAHASKAAPRKAAAADSAGEGGGGYYEPAEPAPEERLGLGTEFGEGRYSSVSYTSFVRAGDRPIAVAELRYNDAAGLQAMGLPAHPLPGPQELWTRETANPFPGDHFARPPGE